MAEEACRPATPADLPRLAELAEQAVEEHRGQKGGEVWARTEGRVAPFQPRLATELASELHLVVVGTLDGYPLGYAVARLDTLADGGRLGVLTDLYAEPVGREVGVGEVMMDVVLDWCRGQGCFGVDSLALPGDRSTKNFFERAGLVARAIVVHRRLS